MTQAENYQVPKLESSSFIFFKDEKILDGKGKLGIDRNRIVEVPGFISEAMASSMVEYFKKEDRWGETAFNGSHGAPVQAGQVKPSDFGLPDSIFMDVNQKLEEAVSAVYGKLVTPSSIHAQKWEVGSSANPHSDNSDFDGNPTDGFDNLKYVGILYLNNDYEGGELYFPEHDISIRPNSGSMYIFSGGVENIHGVTEITNGTRYSIVSFWDFKTGDLK
jgi:predicted 2-oxoglutarate/Fe(II)-dependent dioxygenase YbiX